MDFVVPLVKEQVSEAEWATRCDLAALYRIAALFNWEDLVFMHATAKVPGAQHFLINPYGSLFDEVTASSLVKVDLQGNKVMPSPFEINPAGYTIHSCIHAERPDVKYILHTHSINGTAVSAQKDGLLPLSQFAFHALKSLSYHDYEGLALYEDEKPRLVRDLGNSEYMILRNHGLLTVGESAGEVFQSMHRLEAACMVQVRAQQASELHPIPPEVLKRTSLESKADRAVKARLVWSAMLRRLQRVNPGFDA
ncbi:MAG: class aldolase/adducin family protein [Ramlibacter sp.]|nr:class aldolase/adducin family protein [Ramlibacter sp.]